MTGIFSNMGVSYKIEEKTHQCVNVMFPFLAALIDHATGIVQDAPLIILHTKYSDLVFNINKE